MEKYKKYIYFFIIFFLLLLTWVEEVVIGEGNFSYYLHLPEHKILRFFIRAIYGVIIFIIGYIGLSNFSVKWVKTLWIGFYTLSFIAAGIRIILDIFLTHYLNSNLWNFLNQFYYFCLTPFPYIFLCIMYFLFPEKPKG